MHEWFKDSMDFKVHKKLQEKMRYTTHADQVEICYLYKKSVWSKNFYNKEVDGRTIIDYAKTAITNYFR